MSYWYFWLIYWLIYEWHCDFVCPHLWSCLKCLNKDALFLLFWSNIRSKFQYVQYSCLCLNIYIYSQDLYDGSDIDFSLKKYSSPLICVFLLKIYHPPRWCLHLTDAGDHTISTHSFDNESAQITRWPSHWGSRPCDTTPINLDTGSMSQRERDSTIISLNQCYLNLLSLMSGRARKYNLLALTSTWL